MIDWSVTFLFYTISVNKSAIIMEIKTQYQLYMYAFLDTLTIKNQLLLCMFFGTYYKYSRVSEYI